LGFLPGMGNWKVKVEWLRAAAGPGVMKDGR
jgi:hypothetical protein